MLQTKTHLSCKQDVANTSVASFFEKPDTPLQTSLIAVDDAKGHEVLAGQSTTIKALNHQQDRAIYTPTAIKKDAKTGL